MQNVFFSKTNTIIRRKQCAIHCSLRHWSFSLERYICFCNSAEGLFGSIWVFLYLENSDFQEVLHSITKSIHTGKQWASGLSCSPDCVLQEIHEYIQLSCIDFFGTKWAFVHIEVLICMKYSFQNLIQFSQGSNVLEAAVSNTDGSLCWDTSFFHTAE
jgi:hypothetical protein